MTRSYGYDAATGVLSVMRAGWVLDDVDRFASRVDNVAGSMRSYSYGDAGHPFAVTSVSGVGVYAYDQVGAMVSRAGGTLVYDAMHRLVAHAGESYVQSTSNQRLVVTGPAGRVLYLGEVEVTANGPTRTITRHVTIAGTVVAVTTTTGSSTAVVWSCAHPQNSVTCHAPTGGATPGVRRYHPYGTARNSVTTPATTRGYLGQPADTTGLAYLDNRYYDPALGVFLSVDPLVSKTGTPYLYAAGNPTTLSDPTGLEPGCGATARGNSCSQAHAAADAAWWSAASSAYESAAGGDGSDLMTVMSTLGLSPGAAVPGGLWGDLAAAGWNYFQRLNVFYWQHRLVQLDIARQVPGAVIEFGCGSGSGMRADVCRPGAGEYAEIKPIGREVEGNAQLQAFLAQLRANHGYAPDDPSAFFGAGGGDWPSAGQVGVPGTPISVTYSASAFPGVYTWAYTGGPLPRWADWKVTQREAVKSYAASLVGATSSGINWNAPDVSPGSVGAGIGIGVFLWWGAKLLSPACGPLAPACAIGL